MKTNYWNIRNWLICYPGDHLRGIGRSWSTLPTIGGGYIRQLDGPRYSSNNIRCGRDVGRRRAGSRAV